MATKYFILQKVEIDPTKLEKGNLFEVNGNLFIAEDATDCYPVSIVKTEDYKLNTSQQGESDECKG